MSWVKVTDFQPPLAGEYVVMAVVNKGTEQEDYVRAKCVFDGENWRIDGNKTQIHHWWTFAFMTMPDRLSI